MTDCIFCQIVEGKIPAYKIYEDENFLAFLDIFPLATGHTLVIPKKHYRWVWDVENIGEYFKVCQKIANHFRQVSGEEMVLSMIIGNEVPHPHVHLIPGINKDKQRKLVDNMLTSKTRLEEKEAKELVEKLKLTS
ncbi:HIT family protein [Candidatus Beckwithbacteria bacterium CG23_combo_of_CG06-09_8_20_14_all_34_8]|uniref:HIT family protein n=1 Tax=Candidatus Beckwithbacteria bacterium CG23_combo_of_CG06-09_8_20_14_all_34_8 TaxID=1974497 RepID=A0A2H0B998_9BACT|nr:MAG: HIT family protein [Candidatus Beckwithbacteria bacterium CG23_combo_of_CG06-09_8_20_14_all_34_8]